MHKVGLLALALFAAPAHAGTMTLARTAIPEWKAVYGSVEAKDMVPARARLGGIVMELTVSEGDVVKAGEKIATIRDDKLSFQIKALEAQLGALRSQLDTANTELKRGKALVEKGIVTPQRLEQLQMSADVVTSQIATIEAQRSLVIQQQAEGDVLAPTDGRILTLAITRGAVVLGGEPVAMIGGGGFFLRLSVPERHAGFLKTGNDIKINANGVESAGHLVKIYPQIANGRVVADVEVDKLDTEFVNARVLVELPIGTRDALLVPRAAVTTRSGLDFVTVVSGGAPTERTVVLGETLGTDAALQVEILSGLEAGDVVVTP